MFYEHVSLLVAQYTAACCLKDAYVRMWGLVVSDATLALWHFMCHGVSVNVPSISSRTSRMTPQHTELLQSVSDTPRGRRRIIRADDAFETPEKQEDCKHSSIFGVPDGQTRPEGCMQHHWWQLYRKALYGQTLPMPLC